MTVRTLPLLALAACRCGTAQLGQESSKVEVTPLALDFGGVYLVATPEQSFAVFNAGGGSDQVTLTLVADGGGFALDAGGFALQGGGSQQVEVGFAPTVPGPASAAVHVAWSSGSADVELTAVGLAWPTCPAAGPCARVAFDPNTGSCRPTQLADGSPCDGGSLCLQATECVGGNCLGEPTDCDNGNACVTASCVEGEGCHYQDDSAMCQGSDPCQIYSCDPIKGCQSTTAPDGTPCASGQQCQTASVCVAGSCLGVQVPNGTPCRLWWAPCVSDAACDAGTCDSPTADAYQPGDVLWTAPHSYSSVAVDDAGSLYFASQDASEGGSPVIALDSCGRELWESSGGVDYGPDVMLDGEQVIAVSGVPYEGPRYLNGLSTITGTLLWTVDLYAMAGLCAPGTVCDGGAIQSALTVNLAMSNQELIYVLGDDTQAQSRRVILALFRDGTFDWVQDVPAAPYQDDYELDVDPAGNLYDVWQLGGQMAPSGFDSFDPSGNLRFTVAADANSSLSIGANDLFDCGRSIVWSQTGTELFQLDAGMGSTAMIDAAGVAYYSTWNGQGDGGTILAVKPDGTIPWAAPLPNAVWSERLALGDGHQLYVLGPGDGGILAGAWDTTSGQPLWSRQLSALGNLYPGPAAVTGAGTLVVANGSNIAALFIGPHGTPTGAYWPRERGDNRNRRSGPAGP